MHGGDHGPVPRAPPRLRGSPLPPGSPWDSACALNGCRGLSLPTQLGACRTVIFLAGGTCQPPVPSCPASPSCGCHRPEVQFRHVGPEQPMPDHFPTTPVAPPPGLFFFCIEDLWCFLFLSLFLNSSFEAIFKDPGCRKSCRRFLCWAGPPARDPSTLHPQPSITAELGLGRFPQGEGSQAAQL